MAKSKKKHPKNKRKNRLGEQFGRIYSILQVRANADDSELRVCSDLLDKYYNFLSAELELPCMLTGMGDMGCFAWEERYVFGFGDPSKHERLKRKYPSYTDQYELLELCEDYDPEFGLYVSVKRILEGYKKSILPFLNPKELFILPLNDLKAVDEKSKNYQLLDDYSVWFDNHRY